MALVTALDGPVPGLAMPLLPPSATVRQSLVWGGVVLSGAGSAVAEETPALDAELLLRHALGWSRTQLYTYPEHVLAESQRASYTALVARRVAGEPVAYLIGRREFMGLEFAVDRRVLIPRPETETLVERALELLVVDRPAMALDVGTGSGAIAISLARWRPLLRVHAVDVSPAALEVARGNAQRLLGDEATRVTFACTRDWGTYLTAPDVVAANLPYIPTGDLGSLPRSVRLYEPALALDGGPDGLDCYRALLAEAPVRLPSDAALLMECDPNQAAALANLAATALPNAHVQVLRDLSGAARVVEARREP